MLNKKGSLLLIALWVLAVLVIFALGLGHRAVINLQLAKYQRESINARNFALAGINKVIFLLNQDTKGYDTIDECGISLNGKEPKDIFQQDFSQGMGFVIGHNDKEGHLIYGLRDEESEVNVNLLNSADNFQKNKISALLEQLRRPDAQKLGDALTNWITPSAAGRYLKKEAFKVPDELVLALENNYLDSGIAEKDAYLQAEDVYRQIKSFITIFGDGKININTASKDVISVVISAAAKSLATDTDSALYAAAAHSLTQKILALKDARSFKSNDDINPDLSAAGAQELNLFNYLKSNCFKVKSDCFRIESSGRVNNILKKIIAVYDVKQKKLLSWQEN